MKGRENKGTRETSLLSFLQSRLVITNKSGVGIAGLRKGEKVEDVSRMVVQKGRRIALCCCMERRDTERRDEREEEEREIQSERE